ncbi:DUF4255 domain-containing protein [Granulicella sp. WH15]|uniref:DUF4255 domain-containing protein n=1 Tax=Granulicella sp. WH15 TaxID=2602070 RepID=UPI0013679779|nr:DUF4255 domain-containing protein [Granulicella sp. WH15]QHN04123.1 DUF4255 domain-containing protein [Granulicella sp. WH15]
MSNYLAVAQVTSTLRYIVTNSLPKDLSGASVTTQRPDGQLGSSNTAGVNIFLYRVGPNSSFRNADLPSRDASGNVLMRPTVAFDLDYLFTFYGDDANLEPQRLMGAITVALHEMPVLSADEISKALTAMQPFKGSPFNAAPFNAPPWQPDLQLGAQRVRVSLLPLTLDELSKLWSVFYQIPYALTVAYQASVVLMQRESLVPQSAPPVQTRVVSAQPWNPPTIQAIASNAGAQAPIVAGTTLVITGSGLASSSQTVSIDGYAPPLVPTSNSDQQIIVPLPTDVPAGNRVLRITRLYSLGVPAVDHDTNVSDAAAFALRPTISTPPTLGGGQVTVTLKYAILQGQTATLLLNEATVPAPMNPFAYSVTLPQQAADTTTLIFPVGTVQPGKTYFVRVQVDGVESGLDLNPASPTYGPTVTS